MDKNIRKLCYSWITSKTNPIIL